MQRHEVSDLGPHLGGDAGIPLVQTVAVHFYVTPILSTIQVHDTVLSVIAERVKVTFIYKKKFKSPVPEQSPCNIPETHN